jgi:hypothetical protein
LWNVRKCGCRCNGCINRRDVLITSSPRQKTRALAGVRVWLGFTRAHLGLLGDDLAVAFGCGASEKIGDGVGEANVDAAGS